MLSSKDLRLRMGDKGTMKLMPMFAGPFKFTMGLLSYKGTPCSRATAACGAGIYEAQRVQARVLVQSTRECAERTRLMMW